MGHPVPLRQGRHARRYLSFLAKFLARRAAPQTWVPVLGLAASFALLAWISHGQGELRHGVITHLIHETEDSWIEGNHLGSMNTVIDDEDWKVVFRGEVHGVVITRRVYVTEGVFKALEVGGEFSMDYYPSFLEDEEL